MKDSLKAMKSKSSKKTLADHVFYLGTAKTASNYKTAKDFIVNHILKTYQCGNNIAVALEDKKEFDVATIHPVLQVSSASDAGDAAAENALFTAEFKADLELFAKSKQTYGDNKVKAFTLI